MTVLGKRIIEFLKEDSTLVTLIGNANNIFVESAPLRKDTYVTVSTAVGEDQNNIPADIGMLNVCAVCNRKVANAAKVCMDVAERLDVLLNKQENIISDATYKVINFCRSDSTGLQIDDSCDEYFYRLEFSYIVDETT